MKKQFIKTLKPGFPVDDIFYVPRRDIRERRDGGAFVTFEFQDKTGKVAGIMWDRVEDAIGCCQAGGFYHVVGKFGDYQGKPQLTVSSIYPAAKEEVNRDDFIAATKHDRDKLMAELRGYVAEVSEPHLAKLLKSFFGDPDFVQLFYDAPAAVSVHHAYLGGLLEHTVFMTRAARAVADVYAEINRDLLLAGIILHDIGKTREYVYDAAIDHTYDGRLVGHLVMGYDMVRARIAAVKNFPEELGRMLLHIILSHHGQMEFGSPKTPKFAEALIVHFLDNLDARAAMFRETVEKNPNVKWTDFNQYLETNVYIPDRPAPPES